MSILTYRKGITKNTLNIPVYSDKKMNVMGLTTSIVGPSYTGKTQSLFIFIKNIIQNNSGLIPSIYVFSPSIQQYRTLKNKYKNVYLCDDISAENLGSIFNHIKTKSTKKDWTNKIQNILILDDIAGFMRDKKLEKIVDSIYCTGRHYRLMTYVLIHTIKQISVTQRNNTQIWIIFKCNQENLKCLYDAIQIPVDHKQFISIYNKATEKKSDVLNGIKLNSKNHNFMMINAITGQILRNTYEILYG